MSERVEMDTIVSLCKRRGFVFPSAEIYGGFANAWDYGPLGVEMRGRGIGITYVHYTFRRMYAMLATSIMASRPRQRRRARLDRQGGRFGMT